MQTNTNTNTNAARWYYSAQAMLAACDIADVLEQAAVEHAPGLRPLGFHGATWVALTSQITEAVLLCD